MISTVILGLFAGVGYLFTQGPQTIECQPATKCEMQAFDSVLWNTYGHWTDPIRLSMIEDLSESYGLMGKSSEWIGEQLGTPELTHPFGEDCQYVYWLGPERTLISKDFEWLCLNFDSDVVVEALIVTG